MLKKLFVLLFAISASQTDMILSEAPDFLEYNAIISLLSRCEDKEIKQLFNDLPCKEIQEFVAAVEAGGNIYQDQQCAEIGIIDVPLQILCTVVMPTITALSPFAIAFYAYLYFSDQSAAEFLQTYGYEY